MDNHELKSIAENMIGAEELSRLFRAWITGVIRKARMKAENRDSAEIYAADAQMIISDLNARTKARFRVTDQALSMIISLLKVGYQKEDFYRVHEIKCLKWLGDEKFADYIRPSTLYRPSHFDEYLGEWNKMDAERRAKEDRKKQASQARQVRLVELSSPKPEEVTEVNGYPVEVLDDLVQYLDQRTFDSTMAKMKGFERMFPDLATVLNDKIKRRIFIAMAKQKGEM